ncbi:MAG: hypothetical protein QHH06_05265 [Clostridiales bacterium]|jgi:hypothetical protein|nr:hypothetical protein [Eubacteriales bacterium]MDH7565876.1 hypothetical protein [Clostridiales bacterium]
MQKSNSYKNTKETMYENFIADLLDGNIRDGKTVEERVKAIELGIRENKEEAFFIYEEYIIYHLLDICSGQIDLKEFCHPLLFDLMEYDKKARPITPGPFTCIS